MLSPGTPTISPGEAFCAATRNLFQNVYADDNTDYLTPLPSCDDAYTISTRVTTDNGNIERWEFIKRQFPDIVNLFTPIDLKQAYLMDTMGLHAAGHFLCELRRHALQIGFTTGQMGSLRDHQCYLTNTIWSVKFRENLKLWENESEHDSVGI